MRGWTSRRRAAAGRCAGPSPCWGAGDLRRSLRVSDAWRCHRPCSGHISGPPRAPDLESAANRLAAHGAQRPHDPGGDRRRRIAFDPYDPALVQPSSVDVRVDRQFRVFHNARHPYIDVRKEMEDLTELVKVPGDEPFILHPGRVRPRPDARAGQASRRPRRAAGGQASLGRLGLLIHSTAGFVDAGFEGNLTLELSNVANLPITIYHGMPIGQISFMRMDAPVEHAYGSRETGSKYQGQGEPTAEPLLPQLRALRAVGSPAGPDRDGGTMGACPISDRSRSRSC